MSKMAAMAAIMIFLNHNCSWTLGQIKPKFVGRHLGYMEI